MFLAAADWFEVLAALILFLITGVAKWVEQRQAKKPTLLPDPESGVGTPPRPASPPPLVTPNDDWEAQLRRLLQQEVPPPAPPPPPVLADPWRSDHSRSPSRPGQGGHDEVTDSWETLDAPSRPLADFTRADAAARSGERVEVEAGERMAGAARLASAAHAIDQAAGLHDAVAARMREALSRTETPAATRTARDSSPRSSATAVGALALLRRPDTLRQAIIASVVLQRPKALE